MKLGHEKAKTVLTNGVIYTVEGEDWPKAPAEAVAISSEGIIQFVGTKDGAKEFIGENTKVIDLGGKIVLPGFVDGHCHVPGSAKEELFQIYLLQAVTKEDSLARIAAFVEKYPDKDAYWGGGYDVSIGIDARGPRREWLDEICADKPIIIKSGDFHSLWMNTIALEKNGITKDTPDPPGGMIHKDAETGELWGSISDAFSLITMEMPSYTDEQFFEAVDFFQRRMHGWGYTSLMAIAPHEVNLDIFKKFEDKGELKLKINLSGGIEPQADADASLRKAIDWRESLKDSKLLKVSTVKFFADGVLEGLTAYLCEPYDEAAGMGSDYRAAFYWNHDALKDAFIKVNEAGFQIHVHAIGDGAAKESLDAIEYAQSKAPHIEARNVITHLQLVKDEDKIRMARANVIGNTQTFWHPKTPGWFETVDVTTLGAKRAETMYPVKSLIDVGVRVTFSGDHPITQINNPFHGIQAAVTRNVFNAEVFGIDKITDMDDPRGLLNPAERVSVKEAIEAYTINGAFQLFRENSIGSLTPGKEADIIVMDKDIFSVEPTDIRDIQILATIFNGELVYGKLD